MYVVPVRTLQVLESVEVPRPAKTVVSLALDDSRHYSVEIPGFHCVSSGADTVAAYRDASRARLLAWVDPVSGKVLTVDAWNPALLVMYPALVAIAAILVAGAVVERPLPIGALAIGFVVVAAGCVGAIVLRRKRLALSLRAARTRQVAGE